MILFPTDRVKDHIKRSIEVNEDSGDGKDANMRTIISQAQEIVENENLGKEQINSLIQTVLQLNESNKLKDAKRRDMSNASEQDDKQSSTFARKRIPKKSKEAASNDSDERTELKSILGALDSNVTEGVPKPVREKAPPITKRRPSKWAPIPQSWEEPPTNQTTVRHPWGPYHQRPNIQQQQPPPPLQQQQQPIIHQMPNLQATHVPIQLQNQQQQQQQPSPWEQNFVFNQNALSQVAAAAAAQLPPQAIDPLPKPCNSVNNPQEDEARAITIDGKSRETRNYGKIAVIFMDWDKPVELGFKPGRRRIMIDDKDPVCLSFNNDYIPVNIGGVPYPVKFGVPSRELYIGEHWYECYFGGRQIQIPVDGKLHGLRVEGPPPQVDLGRIRQDLVVAKINMIIDGTCVIPVFLDGKPQTFNIDDEKHVIQFADNLKTALIDGNPVSVIYGDLPRPTKIGHKNRFVRFGALPKNIIPGEIYIKDMIYVNDPPKEDPHIVNAVMTEPEPTPPPTSLVNVDDLLQKLISSGLINNQQQTPAVAQQPEKAQKSKEQLPKLQPSPPTVEPPKPVIPLSFDKPDTIRQKQRAIIDKLMFLGMQCSSCGLRFPPEQTVKYSQHLDWHFRQNRRERDLVRKAHSRKWYYNISDWRQYEEIVDLEEPSINYFGVQDEGNSQEVEDDGSNQKSNLSPPPSCPAGPDDLERSCEVCHERFEQYYNEDLEEWHLKLAIKMDDRFYHPLCYEDYKVFCI